jgi:alkylated DNA repair dioxygenase AlkB
MSIFNQSDIVLSTDNSLITYKDGFLSFEESQSLYEYFLNNLNWVHDEAVIYGKKIVTKRKICWFADSGFDYNYSGASRIANEWNPTVQNIKNTLETETGFGFNSCLLNLYPTGEQGMAWHSDDQNHLDPDSTTVAIISLGAERYFKVRETKLSSNQYKLLLEKGSLLLMQNQTQQYYQHEIPKMLAIKSPRISLTFRTMKKKH